MCSALRKSIDNCANRRASPTHRSGTKVGHDAAHDHPTGHSTIDPGRCPSGCSLRSSCQLVWLCRSDDILPLASRPAVSAIDTDRATVRACDALFRYTGPRTLATRPGRIDAQPSRSLEKQNARPAATLGPTGREGFSTYRYDISARALAIPCLEAIPEDARDGTGRLVHRTPHI